MCVIIISVRDTIKQDLKPYLTKNTTDTQTHNIIKIARKGSSYKTI